MSRYGWIKDLLSRSRSDAERVQILSEAFVNLANDLEFLEKRVDGAWNKALELDERTVGEIKIGVNRP